MPRNGQFIWCLIRFVNSWECPFYRNNDFNLLGSEFIHIGPDLNLEQNGLSNHFLGEKWVWKTNVSRVCSKLRSKLTCTIWQPLIWQFYSLSWTTNVKRQFDENAYWFTIGSSLTNNLEKKLRNISLRKSGRKFVEPQIQISFFRNMPHCAPHRR